MQNEMVVISMIFEPPKAENWKQQILREYCIKTWVFFIPEVQCEAPNTSLLMSKSVKMENDKVGSPVKQ